ncbi:MAG TPA: iron donor protein CyaY [Candidatus Binataceae bacterium]
MDDREFIQLSDQCLGRIAKWLEDLDPDEADYSTGDGVVTIEFPDGGRFILSRQSATRQIWLAADAHGWHYDWDAASVRWLDDKDGHELCQRLSEQISEKIGHPVEFAS